MAKVGSVKDVVNMQLTREESELLLSALSYAPIGGAVAEIESRLMEILHPEHAA